MSSSPSSTEDSPSTVPFSAGTFVTAEETKKPEGIHPIQLYSLATPNGWKVTIALEEMGLKYDAWTVDIRKGIQFTDWFKSVNPNSKIPAIVDKDGPDGKPITLFESGAILIYLAEKTGKFLPKDIKYQTITWLVWLQSGLGPMAGNMGHFVKYATEKHEYSINRYTTETKRLVTVLETQLATTGAYVVGSEYTIADMAIYPWIRCIDIYYGKWKDLGDFPQVEEWKKRIEARPAVQRGLVVNKM